MQQLLQFFALLTLRVLAVGTVIAWGASQVKWMSVCVPAGGVGFRVDALSDGWAFSLLDGYTLLPFGIHKDVPTLREAFGGQGNLLGDHFWLFSRVNPASGFARTAFGISYPLTLFLLFATYAAFWFFSRRRQQSLQSKLADAARLR